MIYVHNQLIFIWVNYSIVDAMRFEKWNWTVKWIYWANYVCIVGITYFFAACLPRCLANKCMLVYLNVHLSIIILCVRINESFVKIYIGCIIHITPAVQFQSAAIPVAKSIRQSDEKPTITHREVILYFDWWNGVDVCKYFGELYLCCTPWQLDMSDTRSTKSGTTSDEGEKKSTLICTLSYDWLACKGGDAATM